MSVISTLPLFGMPREPARRITVEQYHSLIRAGQLTEADRVELLDGWIVPKMPHNPLHDFVTNRVEKRVLGPRLPPEWFTRSQSAVTTEESEPEPDIAVVRGPDERYATRHPGPGDMGMAVEVADSTVQRDRDWKQEIYARARIPIYWLINLPGRQVEVFMDPSGPCDAPRYHQCQVYQVGEKAPLVLDGRTIAMIPAAELLPDIPG